MANKSDRGAVMQFEFDRERILAMKRKAARGTAEITVNVSAHDVIRGALQDVFDNGGTLVVVVNTNKITVVQRPDAEELEAKAE
jgi:hypothetical protein